MERQSMLAVDEIWLEAPSPAMRIGPEVRDWRVNSAARAWADRGDLRSEPWGAVAAELHGALPRTHAGRLKALALDWRRVALDDGWLVWFRPDDEIAVPATPWRSAADKFALVQDLLNIGVFERDFRTLEGRWDASMFKLCGLVEASSGLSLDAFAACVHPEDRAAFRAELARCVRVGGRHRLRFRIVRPDNSVFDLMALIEVLHDAQGVPLTMVGIAVDESESAATIRAQRAVVDGLAREQRAERERVAALSLRIKLVAEAADLGIWSVDGENDHVEWNAEMFKIYGLNGDAATPTVERWSDALVHPDDRAKLVATHGNSLRLGSRAFDAEFRIVRPDGSVRWVTSRSRRDHRDGRDILIGINFDSTGLVDQRRAAAQALHEKDVALRASQSRSNFLARASHELRTPLNAVIGFAQLIKHDGAQAAPALQAERVEHIRSAGEHLLALVDDMLDLAAIEDGSVGLTMAAVSIDAVLSDVAQWSQSLAQRHGVTIELAPCGGWVHADSRRLRQITVNLVNNAIRFNRRGGRVWLGASAQVEKDGVRGTAKRRWHIAVRDDGRGVSAAGRENLFKAFHRLGAEREGIAGAGLGLAIVAQLATLMHGLVEVSSALGEGSEFRVVFDAEEPASAGVPAGAAADAGPCQPGATAPQLTTLYVEDNAVNAILVEGLIALRPGVELSIAVDGLSGVAMAIAQKPQVVLIDMQLPDIDGSEVLRRLRAEPTLRGTRMIALSANAVSEDIARAMALGFDDYWTKPIDFKLFLRRLDRLIEEYRP